MNDSGCFALGARQDDVEKVGRRGNRLYGLKVVNGHDSILDRKTLIATPVWDRMLRIRGRGMFQDDFGNFILNTLPDLNSHSESEQTIL